MPHTGADDTPLFLLHAHTVSRSFSYTFIFIPIALPDENDLEKATCLLMKALKSHQNDAAIVNHVFVALAALMEKPRLENLMTNVQN